MKKILLLFVIGLLFITGCNTKTDVQKEEKKKVPKKEDVVPAYKDDNHTPIGIYDLEGNQLKKLTTIQKTLNVEEDIGVFQIYFSNEDVVSLDKSFAESYYDKFLEYKKDTNLKVGFNIKFHLSTTGEDVSFNILYPNDCMKRWEHLMTYLYDDYQNRGKGFYSHIENHEYNESTLFTAIKIQSSYQVSEIDSPILLTVFTYDSEDDLDEKEEYRGNSSYTMKICPSGVSC